MRPDQKEVQTNIKEMRTEILKDPISRKMFLEKVKELQQDWQEAKWFINHRYEQLTKAEQSTHWFYYWSIDNAKKWLKEIEKEMRKFQFYADYNKVKNRSVLDVERAKSVPISNFLGEWKKTSGQRSTRTCPVHQEKTPSCVWFHEQNRVHCFGCGFNSDSIGLFMKVHSCGFKEAVIELCKY